ncbi:histidine--tRNA ligase [Candidatus Woesearchaeota archaeon]|jgi:histidyl-tRNA synthetase|nr:histidine--tRNA ligase [Candidatus Woesearchaeota archaeon]MBT3537944.1 histidine--tRNA ligase [Candidatus Woesearchaeota archaeon]MBT4698082.1 histidine--tRNA ligase [Candidatus Woesearchaeota archaeon]MBT4717190.1 histidine--tRNA ligase [Candidatus Woesearchaeota archaeon]MBT7105613.1 histidine--tRNA ligase [Candidatus Woesearchaeota archaeon]
MKLQTAKGVRDIPPEEKIVRNRMISTLTTVFERYGFAPLETPIIERFETLAAKGGAGGESDALKETFTLKDQGDRALGLKFEQTTSLARYVGMNPQIKMPFKRYEIGPVFRDGPIKAGRYRQFWQCDVDTVGSKSMLADAEVIAIMEKVFEDFGFDIAIKVNNRKVLNGLLNQAGVDDKEEAIIAIDKLEKIGKSGVTDELFDRGYNDVQVEKIFDVLDVGSDLSKLKLKITDEEGLEGVKELEELFGYLDKMKIKVAAFDVTLARGLAYYTGTVFEAFSKSGPIKSSLAGGGRYDSMVGKFLGGGRDIPAVGVAFGLAPIMDSLKAKEEFKEKNPAKVYVIPIKTVDESLDVVQKLRDLGVNADFDINGRGMSKNLNYANAMGIPFVIIIGENELKAGKVLLRDMASGDQNLLTVEEAAKTLS